MVRIDEGRVLFINEGKHKIGSCTWQSGIGACFWIDYNSCMLEYVILVTLEPPVMTFTILSGVGSTG